jgi:hypothetical protein
MLSKTSRNRSWDSLRDFSASLLFLPAWFLQPHLPVCSHLQAEPPVSFIKMLPAHDLCGAETGQGKAGPQPYRAGPAHCGQDQCQANQIQPNANGQGQADGKGCDGGLVPGLGLLGRQGRGDGRKLQNQTQQNANYGRNKDVKSSLHFLS